MLTHLSVLEESALTFSLAPAFQVPHSDPPVWTPVTYSQFHEDVKSLARYWVRTLGNEGVPQRSVVGLWLGGMTYLDAVHIYSLSRAGYIPQLFSLRLPNPQIIYELLKKGTAKALIHDPSFVSIIGDTCPVPTHCAPALSAADLFNFDTLPNLLEVLPEDIAFIFHTSGSTSGSPKLVPCCYTWLDSMIQKSYQVSKPYSSTRQDASVWMGSMAHIAQSFMLLGSIQHGSCVIQPTKIAFSSDELVAMIQQCRLNRLNQFATFLAGHIRNGRMSPKLTSLMCNLDEVLYSGLPLPREDEDWARQNGINLKNLFGSTEVGAMLVSMGGKTATAALLAPLDGVSYRFAPVDPVKGSEQQTTGQLLELIICSTSKDCPDASLRSSQDGDFHTGDLFQQVPMPDGILPHYAFRGRQDDWIKSENSLRCDTRAIEDHVRAMCGTHVGECIVVGSGRPSPVLFVEPLGEIEEHKLKQYILRRTRQWNSRRYLHEQITNPNMIIVVPAKTLPRTQTKGNIRRQAVEELYKGQLDIIFQVAN